LDFRVLHELSNIVLRHEINLIHSHDYKSDLFAFLLRWKLRPRSLAVISTMHGWALSGWRGRIFWQLDLLLMRQFDRIIAVSHATKSEMVAAGLPAALMSVIYNGIDTKAWSNNYQNSTAKHAVGLGNAFPVIGYVGRISPEKDLETWLRACAFVAEVFPTAQFVLVGDGRDEALLNKLKSLAATLGLAEQATFLGYHDDLPSIYAAFDVFFLSSRREGICNSLLEAMAMEIPLVTTAAGGTQELVVDGESGYIVPEGDAEEMARALIITVQNEHLRNRLVKNARKRIEEHFSFDLRLKNIETLYERILEQRAEPHEPTGVLLPTR
jgi:glycosyltransferase involved in cell wall biosynthesis